jgi:ATP-dependent Zn protease
MASAGLTDRLPVAEESAALATQLRKLSRAATLIALLTSPIAFVWYHQNLGLSTGLAILAAFATVICFRGLVDLLTRRLIPWPSLFGTADPRLREEDVTNRRRAWTWRFIFKLAIWLFTIVTVVFLWQLVTASAGESVTWWGTAGDILSGIGNVLTSPTLWIQVVFVFFLFMANFLIFMGPLMLMGISQIRGYEPGDAEWGVRLDDVRGQAEAKEDVRRVVTLWQSGETFEGAGGKRERGLLFHGAPGTGKTMLAKAIATGFNSPFVSIPGSGFAQTFIGIDALIVRFLARKAKKLAKKWGGQCIVFIDEIDAVGARRAALGQSSEVPGPEFYGTWGALVPGGDLIVETPAWREYLFETRAPERISPYPPWARKIGNIMNQGVFPGMFGGGMGQLALNQLLVTMDGIDNPPFFRRVTTNRVNALLDALYIVPRRVGRVRLRLPAPRPRREQIYFIGATNVPMNVLDPALTRPGRMGRHVSFRTPTKEDRKDIFDLYLTKVAHEQDLDTPARRDEIARITNGYSPAMIEQITSMALTNAHHEGKLEFGWRHLVEAMTVIESGTAISVRYTHGEARATAIHEAGHAVAAHVYRPQVESSRLSIRMRGSSLGHHQSFEKEERFGHFQSELFGDLIHVLGAMAAEHVFYNENTNGVGGDLQNATSEVAVMVGAAGMAPLPPDLGATKFADESPEDTRKRVTQQLEDIGLRLMNRTRGSADFHADPVASVLQDPRKRALAAQLLGQAFVIAYNLMAANKDAVARVADVLVERQEIFGDDLIALLNAQRLVKPEIDWTKDETWPLM